MRITQLQMSSVALGLTLILAGTSALAAETQTLDTILPPSLNPNAANFNNLFSSCGYGNIISSAATQVATAIANRGSSSGATGAAIDAQCPVSDTPPELGNLSCEKFQGPDGLFSQDKFDILDKAVKKADSAVSCKEN